MHIIAFTFQMLCRVVFQTMLITCHPLDKCSVLSPFLQIKKLGFRVIKLVAGHTAGAS